MRSLLLPGIAASLLIASAPTPAEACSPMTCIGPTFAPRDGGGVPANGTLAFRPSGDMYEGNPPDGLAIVRVADETPVEFEVALDPHAPYTYLVRFPAEPEPGVYRATFPDRGCYGDGPWPDRTVSFTVHPAAPLPSWAGQPHAGASARETIGVWTSSGACFADIDAAVSRVGLVHGCDAWPWRDVARYSLAIDGFGEDPLAFYGEAPTWLLHAACVSPDPAADRGIGEGTHEGTVSLRLPGVPAAIGASPVSVTLDCDASGGNERSEAEFCAIEPEVPEEPERPDDWLPDERRSGADAGGCTAAGGGGTGTLPILALACWLARRRR